MRLWSLHPRYLDRQGLTAAWREALLAQAVLAGRTRGYTRHPQLERFRGTADPVGVVGSYLTCVRAEALVRGYGYDVTRVDRPDPEGAWLGSLPVTDGQLELEWRHLLAKLTVRSPDLAASWRDVIPEQLEVHPLFARVPGPVEPWERALGEPAPRRGPPG